MKEKHDGMIRAQIQFERSQYERLKKAAARKGVSMAQLVREGVEVFLADSPMDRWDDLFAIAGKYGNGPREGVGREHDRHLDEAYGDWHKST